MSMITAVIKWTAYSSKDNKGERLETQKASVNVADLTDARAGIK